MKWWKIFLLVCLGALVGCIYGSLFGIVSGLIVPEWFARRRNWPPVWVAWFLGAKTGVKLGGGLACFAILVHTFLRWRKRDTDGTVEPKP
jgi:hypothetical protein